MIIIPPNSPAQERLQYSTFIGRNFRKEEFREVRGSGVPRRTLNYQYNLINDDEIRQFSIEQRNNLHGEIEVPLWHEEVPVEVNESNTSLTGDFSNSNIKGGDEVVVINEDGTYEKTRVTSIIGDEMFTLKTFTKAEYPSASVYPFTTVMRIAEGENNYYPKNAATHQLSGVEVNPRNVTGSTGDLTYYQDKILIKQAPIAEQNTHSRVYNQFPQVVDPGAHGKITLLIDAPHAVVMTGLSYRIRTDRERRTWDGFLNEMRGSFNTFFRPTFLPDLKITRKITEQIFEVSNEPDIILKWSQNQDVRILFNDGSEEFRRIIAITNNGDTALITFDIDLPNKSIAMVSYVEENRIANDVVTFNHFGNFSTIDFVVTTLIRDRTIIVDGASYTMDWSLDFTS